MAESKVLVDCPACGAELSEEPGSRGLCPSCLVELAIDPTGTSNDSTESKGAQPVS